ncbi:META domain-containing protein [Paracidovorax citrulli]|uniref:META domain-containing protein n=1 Tax=Paracidovorax citrulli TaxID=80869 RepID=UPI0009E512BA|nr:META domain-containing protein [Paracidovorax citrulli]UEG47988.1 META domain-containing protein [Paracidovorax citrulli]UMT88766.1 META domain-containing protein [Paracidovorax citrulli]UMT96754.1 META domain-containing protein [Paracidovorax citrulli]WIY36500.1 META domain-containing protein [Paracidovorax citrulli]
MHRSSFHCSDGARVVAGTLTRLRTGHAAPVDGKRPSLPAAAEPIIMRDRNRSIIKSSFCLMVYLIFSMAFSLEANSKEESQAIHRPNQRKAVKELTQNRWTLKQLPDWMKSDDFSPEKNIELAFEEPDILFVVNSCNGISFNFIPKKNNRIRFRITGVTLIACKPEIMNLEGNIIHFISQVDSYKIIRGTNTELILKNKQGEELRFEPQTIK